MHEQIFSHPTRTMRPRVWEEEKQKLLVHTAETEDPSEDTRGGGFSPDNMFL